MIGDVITVWQCVVPSSSRQYVGTAVIITILVPGLWIVRTGVDLVYKTVAISVGL